MGTRLATTYTKVRLLNPAGHSTFTRFAKVNTVLCPRINTVMPGTCPEPDEAQREQAAGFAPEKCAGICTR
jgi:hypothetical protein